MRPARRGSALLLAATLVAGCSAADREQFSAPPVTVSASSEASSVDLFPSDATSATVDASTSAGPTEASAESPSTVALVDQLGVGAVTPWGTVTAEDIDRAVQMVASLDVAGRAGSVLMVSSRDAVGTGAVGNLGLGGVILGGSLGILDGTLSGTPSEVAELTASLSSQVPASQAGFPLLVGTDQEFGLVQRLVTGFTDIPSQQELGDIPDLGAAVQATQQATAVAGSEMAAVGINVDFAPVSDVIPPDGASEMLGRSFGSDPNRVAALVTAAVAGYQSAGIAATLKHFPGLGELSADTHLSLQSLSASCPSWNAVASVPIRAGTQAGVAMVMTGHATFPAVDDGSVPTSLSGVMDQLLRGDPSSSVAGCTPIGYTGIRITDSLQMAPITGGYSSADAAWQGLAAGEDLLLMPVNPEDAVTGILQAVDSGQLAVSRLNEAAVRVFALRSSLSRSVRPGLDTVGSAENQAIADQAWALVN